MNEIESVALSNEQKELFRDISQQVLDSLQDWLKFFEDTKFYSTPYIFLFLNLFNAPGQKKSDLIFDLQSKVRVSHSTAQRMLKEAEEAGHLVVEDRDEERGLATNLSPALYNHCVEYLSSRTKKALEHVDVSDALDVQMDQDSEALEQQAA